MKKIIALLVVGIFVLSGCGQVDKVKTDVDDYYASLTKDIEDNEAALESWEEDTTVEIKDQETEVLFNLFTTFEYGTSTMEEVNEMINEMRVDFAKATEYRIGDITKGSEKDTYNVHMFFKPVLATKYVADAFDYQYNLYEDMIKAIEPDWNALQVNNMVNEVMNDSFTIEFVKIGNKIYTFNINQYKMAVSQMIYYDEWLEEGSMMSDSWIEEDIEFTKVDGKYIPSSDTDVDFEDENPALYTDYYFITQESEDKLKNKNSELYDEEGNNIAEIPEEK